uniref:Uncharacterized protein n=1 Tax=Arundo donax TaxID=35708 RepID=A0A0A9FVZ5_ARUDO
MPRRGGRPRGGGGGTPCFAAAARGRARRR